MIPPGICMFAVFVITPTGNEEFTVAVIMINCSTQGFKTPGLYDILFHTQGIAVGIAVPF